MTPSKTPKPRWPKVGGRSARTRHERLAALIRLGKGGTVKAED